MHTLLSHQVSKIWLLLIIATGISWAMGGENFGALSSSQMASCVLIIALLKVRFVLRHFMEVNTADIALRLITDAWVVFVCATLLYLYWN